MYVPPSPLPRHASPPRERAKRATGPGRARPPEAHGPRPLTVTALSIADALRETPEYISAENIACYLHLESGEVETTKIIQNAFNDQKRVFLPRITPLANHHNQLFPTQSTELQMLEVKSMAEIDQLQPEGKYKLREPPFNQLSTTSYMAGGLNLIIVPGLAFTSTCQRLGHGRGYYDGFTAIHDQWTKNNSLPRAILLGIALDVQLVDSIPMEPHDRILDAVIVGDGTIYRK